MFREGNPRTPLRLATGTTSSTGVLIATYERAAGRPGYDHSFLFAIKTA